MPEQTSSLDEFLDFGGRVDVWEKGLDIFQGSPLLGRGFHADRLLLNTHMHNVFMHALVQTGVFGTIPLMIAFLYAWLLLVRALVTRRRLPTLHQHLVIQAGAVLAFLSLRAVFESSGAFYGVDWFILAPILFYLDLVNQTALQREERAAFTADVVTHATLFYDPTANHDPDGDSDGPMIHVPKRSWEEARAPGR